MHMVAIPYEDKHNKLLSLLHRLLFYSLSPYVAIFLSLVTARPAQTTGRC